MALSGTLSGGSALSGALSGGSLGGCMSGGLSRQQVNQMIWDILPTDTASGAIASFSDGADGVPVEALTVSLEPIQSGSGTPSPDNVRPITGHTSVGVTRTGKNLLPINDKTLTNDNWFSVDFDPPIKVSGSMTVSTEIETNHSASTCRLALYNGNTALRFFQLTPNAGRVSVTSSVSGTITRAVYLAKETSGSFTGTTVWKNTQLELGSATTYEPYTATHISIPLGQTVYGGTVDVVNGVLTVTDANIASYNGETLPSTWISDRDAYSAGATPTTGAQVVYKLAQPIEIQLTPNQLTTLLGTNNIWSDSGDVSVEYRADIQRYIAKVIAEAIS